MDCLIHPTYFPNIAHFASILNSDIVHLEVCDHYQKQTFRNRSEIYGANGKLTLSVPVRYSQINRQQFKDVKISYVEDWQQNHLKSLQSAYSVSPFYEYYIDDLMPLFENKFNFLLDLNLKCLEILNDSLQIDFNKSLTSVYEKNPVSLVDYRYLVNKKHLTFNFITYPQVFSQKHGFISNLSILDLLFNEGPNTELYLSQLVLE